MSSVIILQSLEVSSTEGTGLFQRNVHSLLRSWCWLEQVLKAKVTDLNIIPLELLAILKKNQSVKYLHEKSSIIDLDHLDIVFGWFDYLGYGIYDWR